MKFDGEGQNQGRKPCARRRSRCHRRLLATGVAGTPYGVPWIGHVRRLGDESPLCSLMEVQH
ncbi:MAG: hypothetical protein ACRECP_06395 [Methylocella sp.]